MAYTLPQLPYAYDALEPNIDAQTMEIHHTKHHQTYINNVNAALEGTEYADLPVEELVSKLKSLPENLQGPVRNNGGGHANHSLFWTVMSPNGGGEPKGEVAKAIDKDIGGFEKFKEAFTKAALSRFGSGGHLIGRRRRPHATYGGTPLQASGPVMAGPWALLPVMLRLQRSRFSSRLDRARR